MVDESKHHNFCRNGWAKAESTGIGSQDPIQSTTRLELLCKRSIVSAIDLRSLSWPLMNASMPCWVNPLYTGDQVGRQAGVEDSRALDPW